MRITKGTVVDGHIVVEGEPLSEGSTVTILVPEERIFTLDKKDEAALLLALDEADKRDFIDAEDLLKRL